MAVSLYTTPSVNDHSCKAKHLLRVAWRLGPTKKKGIIQLREQQQLWQKIIFFS